MKHRPSRLIYLIAAMLGIVCAYQLYWLVGQYKEIERRLGDDIHEALRSADFEELVHRVELINKMEYEGRVEVNMGYDHKEQGTIVQSGSSNNASNEAPRQSDSQITVSPTSFGSVLRTPEDLVQIGLYMQKGIHSSLDAIHEVDLEYLDRKISEKLDSLGVGGEHTLLYIRSKENPKGTTANDTLAKFGNTSTELADQFSLELPDNCVYRMIIPQWQTTVLKKMLPMILFSLATLLLLCVTFMYLTRMMNRQKELEDIKTDFTNNITHELKTPIAVAYAANDALLNYNPETSSPRLKRYLGVCQEQLRLLDRLVEQILALSMERRQSLILNMEPVMIKDLIQSLTATYSMKYQSKVDFQISVDDDLSLLTDRMHISNIIGNLVDNAIKYSAGKAEVAINASADSHGGVTIEVCDHGIGMTREQCEKIFDKFYRVPHGNLHEVKGYGLGLFYVKSMSAKLGGSVSVQSKVGNGSIFTLYFKSDQTDEKNKGTISGR